MPQFCIDERRSHHVGVPLMLIGAGATYAATSLAMSASERHALAAPQRLDIACFEFLAWWWIAYFGRSHLDRHGVPGRFRLFTLRSYLDGVSSHRRGLQKVTDNTRDEDLLREKARSSRDVQGIMIAVVVLLLTLIVIMETQAAERTTYHRFLHAPLFAVALATIIVWILSMDIFDTVLNSFQVEVTEAFNLRRFFYREVGPLRPDGGVGFAGAVSYGYLGHALMPIFVLMVFSWFEPSVVGFATAMYVVLAYPYYYGYWAIQAGSEHVARGDVVEKTELVQHEQWVPLSDGQAEVFPRWVVNRDGDRVVASITGDVRRGSNGPAPHRWPIMVLGSVFLAASVVAVV